MIIGRQFAESQCKEKLYSTGDNYLDELLEKAFCEGYEYAQKEFAKKNNEDDEDKPKKSTIRKVGKGVAIGGAAASLAGGIAENVLIDRAVDKAAREKGLVKLGHGANSTLMGINAKKAADEVVAGLKKNKKMKVAKAADIAGLSAAALGTGAYLYGRHKDKKKAEQK